MRILMAAMVASLGMVGVHAADHHNGTKTQTTSGGKYAVPVTTGGGGHHHQSTGASGPAQGVDYRNSQQVLFKWIKPGTFEMGSPSSEPDRRSDEVQHTVQLTRGFWLSDHEVTQGEYLGVMGVNPSYFQGDPNRPVEKVSWNDAVKYCENLTKRERSSGKIGRAHV